MNNTKTTKEVLDRLNITEEMINHYMGYRQGKNIEGIVKVVKTGKTPDGIDIQIEDWRPVFPDSKSYVIGFFPKAKVNCSFIRKDEAFKVCTDEFKDNKEATRAFSDLEKGVTTIKDYSHQFSNMEREILGY